jgi:YkoY family integral membrane protein
VPAIQVSDILTILLLIALEGILSADNAMVLAIRVLSLPKHQQTKALRYGMISAFSFRATATALAAYLIALGWVKLVGGLYLLWLPYQHFFGHSEADGRQRIKPATPWLGLSPFWATVVKVELTDIVFAIDSILVAVAVSDKLWVVITGGILGIVMMRLVIGQLLALIRRYPALVDGAFVIITWVGIKLLLEYSHARGWVHFEIPKWFSLGLIVVIMGVAYVYARRQGPVADPDEEPLDQSAAVTDATVPQR